MVFPSSRFRALFLLIPTILIASVLAACTTARAGSATVAVSTSSGSVSPGLASTRASPTTASAVESAADPTDTVSGAWEFAHVTFGDVGIPSPTGDLTAQPSGNRVCFAPGARCAELAGQDRLVFAVYSPDGAYLLAVAGPDGSPDRSVYVLDTVDAGVRVIGPDGVADASTGEPPRWNLSSVAWSADGSSVVIVPHTEIDTGPLLSADLDTGSIAEQTQLDAAVANSRPSIWPTENGTALVANDGPDRETLWWQYPETAPKAIAGFQQDGGSMLLSAADRLGRVVLACPRAADGRLGATVYVGVDSRKTGRLLTDSGSCAGAVFSPDSRQVALTAELAGSYSLVIVEVMTNRRVLTVPLPVATPSQPPYLTWLGDVVVAADVSGEWSAPSLIMRLGP